MDSSVELIRFPLLTKSMYSLEKTWRDGMMIQSIVIDQI